jgi:hypothetical protein
MVSSKGAGFAGILQSLAGLERVSTRSAFAKMRVWKVLWRKCRKRGTKIGATMGAVEEYKARNAAREARRAEKQQPPKKFVWWFREPLPIDRFTGWLVAFTALLFVATIVNAIVLWITDHTLRETLEANNRAWVAVTSAISDAAPVLNQVVTAKVNLRNSGQSPALKFAYWMNIVGVAAEGEDKFTYPEGDICSSASYPGATTMFPSATPVDFGFTTIAQIRYTQEMIDKKVVLFLRGCAKYETFKKMRFTRFCYYLRDKGASGRWYWHDCGAQAN